MLWHFAVFLYNCRVNILLSMTMERNIVICGETASEVCMTSCYHTYSGYVFSAQNDNKMFLL